MTYSICYCAKYPNGDLLDKDQPFKTAYIEAGNEKEACISLKLKFPGMKLSVHSIKNC